MREIKYRAWFWHPCVTLVNKGWPDCTWQGAWLAGDVLALYLSKNRARARPDNKAADTYDLDIGEKCIIREWTGLKDKNGREIYEGDVVEIPPYGKRHRAIVKWESVPGSDDMGTDMVGFEDFHNPIVIGDIYENPELLEAPK